MTGVQKSVVVKERDDVTVMNAAPLEWQWIDWCSQSDRTAFALDGDGNEHIVDVAYTMTDETQVRFAQLGDRQVAY